MFMYKNSLTGLHARQVEKRQSLITTHSKKNNGMLTKLFSFGEQCVWIQE